MGSSYFQGRRYIDGLPSPEFGVKPHKIVDAIIAKGRKYFMVKFRGHQTLARVPELEMKAKHPQVNICIYFLVKT